MESELVNPVNWFLDIRKSLCTAVQGDQYWEPYLRQSPGDSRLSYSMHLAVFVEPYLQYILTGKKTVESRFSTRRIAPYGRVQAGDVILLKRSSGPIVGICVVKDVWFYQLDPKSWRTIRDEFTRELCAQDPTFWHERRHASFATLARIERVRLVPPIRLVKRDRRGWVVLHNRQVNMWESQEPKDGDQI